MKQEYIKKGMDVIIRGKVVLEDDGCPILNVLFENEAKDSSFWVSAKDIEPAPAKPKYDPARKFKKGDCVSFEFFNGRYFGGVFGLHKYTIGKVEADENENHEVLVDSVLVPVCYLGLVESIEDYMVRPLYFVEGDNHSYFVHKKGEENPVAEFSIDLLGLDGAKQEAEELCAKLSEAERSSKMKVSTN